MNLEISYHVLLWIHRKWESLEQDNESAMLSPQSPTFGRHVRREEESLLLTSSDG